MYLSLIVVFCKADKKEEVTDPPIVIRSDVFVCLSGTDIKKVERLVKESKKESTNL